MTNDFLQNKTIVVTRTAEDNIIFKQKLESYGATVFEFPAIKIIGNIKDKIIINTIRNIFIYDWVLFTSAKGVSYFMKVYESLGIDIRVLQQKKIAVVGSKTAEKVKEYGLQIDFMPTKYTTEQLALEMSDIKNKKILVVRADIGSKEFISGLFNKGAQVTDIPIYKTEYLTNQDALFEDIIKQGKIDYITF